MKHTRKLVALLTLATLLWMSWGLVSAQQTVDLSQSHTTTENITFNFPAGWTLVTDTNFTSITDGKITIEFYTSAISDSILSLSENSEESIRTLFTLNAVDYQGDTTVDIAGQTVVGGFNLDAGQGQYVFLGIARNQLPPGWTFISVKGAGLDLLGATDTIVAIVNSYGSFQIADTSVTNVNVATLTPPNTFVVTAQPTVGTPCLVRARGVDATQLRVGPGNNRSVLRWLEADRDFTVVGTNVASDGSVWWRLDKSQAAPQQVSAVNETWVADSQVVRSGDCDTVGIVAAPPIIRARPTAAPTGTPDPNSGGNNATPQSSAEPDATLVL
jgi:hypothetical protein